MLWRWRYPERRRVIVNTKTGKAFTAVLWCRRWRYVILKDAALVRPSGEPLAIEGEVLIDRANIDFIQVV